ncbi:glycosyltransferase family 2 protein [Candidatus Micrarchaeota archaeon]|nr:glycosyltransferase family 2 protein [Candidatus Micrarchaeota archaeon]
MNLKSVGAMLGKKMQKKSRRCPLVSIVVLNWNNERDTIECLNSLKKLDYPLFEVILVDNGSKHESVEKLTEYVNDRKNKGLKIALVENKENEGFAGGNNRGIELALAHGAEYVMFLNNDATVDPNAIGELVNEMEQKDGTGIAGSKIYYYDKPDMIWSAGGTINWFIGKGSTRGRRETDERQYDKVEEVDQVIGCAMMVKRGVFDAIGFLDETYFSYYEETQFCARARKKGYAIYYVPSSIVYHKVAKSTGGGTTPTSVYYLVRNRGFFILDAVPFYFWPTALLSLFAEVFVRSIVYLRKGRWVAAKAAFVGLKDFLLGRKSKRGE